MSYVYLIEFSGKDHNEKFYKVGYSKDPSQRAKSLSSPIYETKLIRSCMMCRKIEAVRREKELHNYLHREVYKPAYHFPGSSECFVYDSRILNMFTSMVNNIYHSHEKISNTSFGYDLPVSLFLDVPNHNCHNAIIGSGISDIIVDADMESWVVIRESNCTLELIEGKYTKIFDEKYIHRFSKDDNRKLRKYMPIESGSKETPAIVINTRYLRLMFKVISSSWWYNRNYNTGTDWTYPDLLFKEMVLNNCIDFNSYI